MSTTRKSYPSDVSDAEWEFLIPYLTLMRDDAPRREYLLRDVFDGVRYVVKTGCQWDFLPHDFPPSSAVYQQARRWIAAGVFEDITHDLRMILRMVDEREAQPTAAILDGRTLQSTPESGGRAGYDGAKKKNGSKVHIAVDTMGNLLAVKVTAANEQERAQVAQRLGISCPTLLYRWKQQQLHRSGPVAASLDERVRELEAELLRVQRERDILKKALAIFGRNE